MSQKQQSITNLRKRQKEKGRDLTQQYDKQPSTTESA